MLVLRSTNTQMAFRPLNTVARMAAVVYDGLPVQSAVVVYSGVVVQVVGGVVRSLGRSLLKGTAVVPLVQIDGFIVPGVVGSRSSFGGVVVLDLIPGDLLTLVCNVEDGGEYEFGANGLTVVVL